MKKYIFIAMIFPSFAFSAPSLQDKIDMQNIEEYMQKSNIEAEFVSDSKNGKTEGMFEYSPGHIKIMYTYPYHALLLANDNKLFFHDDNDASTTHISISHQPLGVFLSNDINKWEKNNLIIQRNPNIIQLSLANQYGVVAVNYTNNQVIKPYSIDIKEKNGNIRHIVLKNIKQRTFGINNFDEPIYSEK